MTDGQMLFLVLCALYLSDCLVWVGRRAVLFTAPWCGRWRASFTSPHFGNANGGLACLNPLLPLGAACLGRFLPVAVSPDGVCDFAVHVAAGPTRPDQTGAFVRHDAITEVRADGKFLVVNGSRFAKCDTPDQAVRLADLIGRIKTLPMEARAAALRDRFGSAFRIDAAQARLEQCGPLAREVRRGCTAFFLLLYVLLPSLACGVGVLRVIIPAAIVMLAGGAVIAVHFYQAHAALYPPEKGDRIGHVVKMVTCPPAAIRAHDLLTLESMAPFHPVLVAHLLQGADAAGLVSSVIRDLKYPVTVGLDSPEAAAVVAWHAAAELDACAAFLQGACARRLEDMLPTPEWDGSSTMYCPRCLCQLTTSADTCPDCPGVELRRLPTQQTTEVRLG